MKRRGRPPGRKYLSTTCYLDADQVELLRRLNQATKVATTDRVREGIDLVLAREADKLPAQLELGGAGK